MHCSKGNVTATNFREYTWDSQTMRIGSVSLKSVFSRTAALDMKEKCLKSSQEPLHQRMPTFT